MNDDSLTPEAELASAALDNEVTDAERAQVAASPSLGDELAFYTDLRTELADVAVPAEGRESALAAALAVFDELQPAELQTADSEPDAAVDRMQSVAVAPVVSLHARRQRQYRWIGGAAAAAVVTVLAIGVLANLGGGSDQDSSTAEFSARTESETNAAAAAPEVATAEAEQSTEAAADDEPALAAPSDTASGELAAIPGPAEVSDWVAAPRLETDNDVIAFVTGDEFAKATSTADSSTQGDAATATTAAATGSPTAGAPETSTASAATTSGGDTAAFSRDCLSLASGPYVAVIYQGEQVYVVLDETNGEILIVDPNSCVATTLRLP